ncbi:alpha-2Db adrenergic receptor-like [Ruditapes philippinarum]|uniref:alpha-2Db adrenergic receptor-like n=1 Tax=Ruditapes philippinarum TaxID=129788 RepID=UPI00295AE060|nr:alpha-2Db adrenergic receptor-like [Ruditapes philippinarum]
MDNSTRPGDEDLLEKINREEVLRQVPLITFLIILAIIGTLGNLLVCYVYTKKYSASNCRTFIIVLSAVDVFVCAVIIPFEIMVLMREYNFKHAWICKVSVFLNTWLTLTAGCLLLAIAIDRYRKVCRPFSWQITHVAARNMCIMAGLLGLAFSWISPVIYGAQKSTHSVYNITISQCTETYAMQLTVWPLINNISFAVLFIGALTGIVVMYCFIAIRVRQHIERKSMFLPNRQTYIVNDAEVSEMTIMSGKVAVRRKAKLVEDDTSDGLFRSSDSLDRKGVNETSEPEKTSLVLCSVDRVKSENRSVNRKSVISRMLSFGRHSLSLTKSLSTSTTNSVRQNIRIDPEAQRQKQRTAYIMFLISLAFIISYLPLICLLLIRVSDSTFVPSLNDTERAVYKFCLRSYYINCVVNPFIYGLWDSIFRKSCRNIVCKGICK